MSVEVSAQLENVSSISTPEEYPWHLKLRCSNCGEVAEKPVVVSASDNVEGIRGASVSVKINCKFCKRVNDLKIVREDFSYTDDMAPAWKPFLQVDCRGVQPVEWTPASDVPLVILGSEGFKCDDSFIEDGEYYGYDENMKTDVAVTELKVRIVKG